MTFIFLQYIHVYVKKYDNDCIERWRMKLFESFGGKTHVRCECCKFPLIPSYQSMKNKCKCNVNIHIDDNGMRHQINNVCTKQNHIYVVIHNVMSRCVTDATKLFQQIK